MPNKKKTKRNNQHKPKIQPKSSSITIKSNKTKLLTKSNSQINSNKTPEKTTNNNYKQTIEKDYKQPNSNKTEKDYNFLQRQMNELSLSPTKAPVVKGPKGHLKKDVNDEEQYLKFKYQELPFMILEEDLTNILKRVVSEEKSSRSIKLKKVTAFFMSFFFNEGEIDAMFFSMFANRDEGFMKKFYKLHEKRSLIQEALCNLLFD